MNACRGEERRHPLVQPLHGGSIHPAEVVVVIRRSPFALLRDERAAAGRAASKPVALRHLLEHADGVIHLLLADDRQVRRRQVLDPAAVVQPLVGLLGIGVDVIGHELLAVAQHFKLALPVEHVVVDRATGLAPARVLGAIDQQHLGRLPLANARDADVREAPILKRLRQLRVRRVDVDRTDRVRPLSGDDTDPVVWIARQVFSPQTGALPLAHDRRLAPRPDGHDQIAISQ